MKRKIHHISSREYEKMLKSRAFENGGSFEDLDDPKEGDWRSEYEEETQTFSSYKRTSPTLHTKESTIYLVSFVDESKVENASKYLSPFPCHEIIEEVAEYIRLFVDVGNSKLKDVILLDQRNLVPEYENERKKSQNLPNKYLCRIDHSRRRRTVNRRIGCRKPCLDHIDVQVCATDILSMMVNMLPNDAYDLVGITNLDLYDIPATLFVSGFARGSVAIQSFARYDPFYLEKRSDCEFDTPLSFFNTRRRIDTEERKKKIILASCKTISHEIMHNFGLGHCLDFKCLMNGSGNLEEDQKAPHFLCPNCLKKMFHFSRFKCPVERYRGLQEFFRKFGSQEEVGWIQRRIGFLQDEKTDAKEEYYDVFDVEENVVVRKKRKLD